jgi:hypothetical protein
MLMRINPCLDMFLQAEVKVITDDEDCASNSDSESRSSSFEGQAHLLDPGETVRLGRDAPLSAHNNLKRKPEEQLGNDDPRPRQTTILAVREDTIR